MNQVNLIGRVVRDPKLHKTGKGKPFMFLTLAVDGYYDRKKKEMTSDFISIKLWSNQAERCAHLVKGSLISIMGRISVSKYPDKATGETKYNTDIVAEEVQFLSKPRSSMGNTQAIAR
ncbi:single-stranded DNA-binding protein [Hazenella sp. IB182357]|uniref:Single-stranded DNA-binding protein n=1 Tax=Polycladospora coralii TaxID=2771432 RepID=A0A926N784_9BACL|nr:single-stranded DNA-binding protein [Polycladospora coralii]MBD1371256.1 single-stranded DNA-binding protein [Polycladospora coralii]MBS7530198.1 single-stranded DNA-binding protein [Polycladospora coralii]MBS7530210.1 single-stranded DNA-binding protein [Polycladospora coralii]